MLHQVSYSVTNCYSFESFYLPFSSMSVVPNRS